MTEIPEQPSGLEVCRVAVRLPHFWPDRPAIWFAQAESQFELAAITHQRTKFKYVVSQLNQRQASEVEDITTPPGHEPYDRLKAELICRLSTSREQRVRQLLSHEEMGDRKPSQFLRHLKSLAPDVPDDFLRTIWTSRLPPHVQAILAGQTDGNLESTAQLADKICEVTTQPTTASISPAAPTTRPHYLNALKSYRNNSLIYKRNIHAPDRCPEYAIAHNHEIVAAITLVAQPNLPTYADTTGHSEMELANALHHAPTKTTLIRLLNPGRKTPTANANGG